MASMTIRNIDETLKRKLRIRAAHHGRSMEDEARDILRTALSVHDAGTSSLVQSIRSRLPDSGIELEQPTREPVRDAPDFGRQ